MGKIKVSLSNLTSWVVLLVALFTASSSLASETVRVGVLKFGTVNWELDAMKHHGLDKKNNIELEVKYFAGDDATQIALMAGDVDLIVSDWLAVSRQRAMGDDLTMTPYSTATGSLMVPKDSPIKSLGDLKGKKVGVAGGPLDKNWLLIQGLAQKDFSNELAKTNDIVFGAPPLLAEKARQGELDAVLNFWQYCALLEADGFRQLVTSKDMLQALGAAGPVSSLGYVFHEKWAKENPELIKGFIAASAETKSILAKSDDEWIRLSPVVKAEGNKLKILRDRFREGIPNRATAEEEKDAHKLYSMLLELGGKKLVGPSEVLMPGTFWRPQ